VGLGPYRPLLLFVAQGRICAKCPVRARSESPRACAVSRVGKEKRMKDLFLHIESLESRRLFSVDVVPSPPGPASLSVEVQDVSIEISATKGGAGILDVETPGADFTETIGHFLKK
jgi:hypothetical protein